MPQGRLIVYTRITNLLHATLNTSTNYDYSIFIISVVSYNTDEEGEVNAFVWCFGEELETWPTFIAVINTLRTSNDNLCYFTLLR